MIRDIGFAHLGNGITVYDRLHEKNGDYECVAHISATRAVKYYVDLAPEAKAEIEDYAATATPDRSATQKGGIFTTPAKELNQ